MRIPMLTSLVFVVLIIGLGFTDSRTESKDFFQGTKSLTNGKVLGAIEDIRNELGLSQGLPESQDKKINIPQKISSEDFELENSHGIVIDCNSGFELFNKDADKKSSIASLTKLMTALVFLDHNPGWDDLYEVKREDRREGGKIYIYTGEKIKIKDLFHASLVASANTATVALAKSTGMSEAEFVEKMNEKAKEMGLKDTSFMDVTGLDFRNYSTAREISKIVSSALDSEDIRNATLLQQYEFTTSGGKKKIVYSTDQLLGSFEDSEINLDGGKTGYNNAAGYCFASKFTNNNKSIVSVVLGEVSKSSRFTRTKELVGWVFDNYQWN